MRGDIPDDGRGCEFDDRRRQGARGAFQAELFCARNYRYNLGVGCAVIEILDPFGAGRHLGDRQAQPVFRVVD